MVAQDTPFIYHPRSSLGCALKLRMVYKQYILGNHSLSITYTTQKYSVYQLLNNYMAGIDYITHLEILLS